MSWSIEISDAAHEDLRDIYSYIAFKLRSPENARNVLQRILAQVATLDEMPERFRPYPRKGAGGRGGVEGRGRRRGSLRRRKFFSRGGFPRPR